MQKSYENTRILYETGCFCGASDLTRTGDLLITSEMHYRLCYTSNFLSPVIISKFRQIVNNYLQLQSQLAGLFPDGQQIFKGLRAFAYIPQKS